jgi:hypothetical protein
MGMEIDSSKFQYPVNDSFGKPEPEPSKEQKLALLLLKKYGRDAFRHAANMCAHERYKKNGINCDKVVDALNELVKHD